MLKYLMMIILLFLLSACSAKQTEIISKPVERPSLNLQDPSPVVLKSVRFIIVTPENVEEVFRNLEANREEVVLFALTGLNYKNLALNVDALKQFMKTQNEIIRLYRDFYEKKPQ
jgi:hypothetical protein